MTQEPFLGHQRLLDGPWQAFERDVARLLMHSGFIDVRLVGGSGDGGADILAVRDGNLWVFQCKHSTNTPPKAAISEVVAAGRLYQADRLAVATSRAPTGEYFKNEINRYASEGLRITHVGPDKLLALAKEAPEYCSARKSLREYQETASDRFREALIDTGRGQIVLATGLGKTVIMAETVADMLRDGVIRENRVLVLAHTKPLVAQLHRSFWPQLPKWVHTHQLGDGERPSYWEGVTFATIQSAQSVVRDLPPFGLVLIDEAHHVGSETFRAVIDIMKPAMLGGVTATPWRGDSFDIDTILGQPQVRMGIADGLQRGFLAEVDYRLLADNLDWTEVQNLSKNKYSLSQLNRKLLIPTRDEEAAKIIATVKSDEKISSIICFSPTIMHARSFAERLNSYGIASESVSSEEDSRERELRIARFKAKRYQCLTTVDLFNEGVDLPNVDMLVFMRATHSRRIFVQQLGRGLRLGDRKSRVVVLDFVSDLRRMAEVIDLDAAVKGGDVERLGLGKRLIQFSNESAGTFLREWILDQCSLFKREDDPKLEIPGHDFPEPLPPGSVE